MVLVYAALSVEFSLCRYSVSETALREYSKERVYYSNRFADLLVNGAWNWPLSGWQSAPPNVGLKSHGTNKKNLFVSHAILLHASHLCLCQEKKLEDKWKSKTKLRQWDVAPTTDITQARPPPGIGAAKQREVNDELIESSFIMGQKRPRISKPKSKLRPYIYVVYIMRTFVLKTNADECDLNLISIHDKLHESPQSASIKTLAFKQFFYWKDTGHDLSATGKLLSSDNVMTCNPFAKQENLALVPYTLVENITNITLTRDTKVLNNVLMTLHLIWDIDFLQSFSNSSRQKHMLVLFSIARSISIINTFVSPAPYLCHEVVDDNSDLAIAHWSSSWLNEVGQRKAD
ncbi:hypothetical protein Tco_0748026 [Tanacetum coccineum]|uniref:Uncharacterized protein n=1 Tax=Tanacetum coccineum TaxID=301880 RepID=A0ABQ4YVC3_9ASTR